MGISDRIFCFAHIYTAVCGEIKYSYHEKTNYEEIIGKVVRITERVDNLKETGTAVINGLEWTARAERDEEIIEPGDQAEVVRISGVKVIVKKNEEK